MKDLVKKKVSVPPYQRVISSIDVINFSNRYGLPFVIKPAWYATLSPCVNNNCCSPNVYVIDNSGMGSVRTWIIRTQAQLNEFLGKLHPNICLSHFDDVKDTWLLVYSNRNDW
jgi:hypothetical protein